MSAGEDVLAVIGVGGMGLAIARRLGSGAKVLLADFNSETLAAAALGPVLQVAHTAVLSPVQASIQAIIGVNLMGVAHVLDEFAQVIAPGGAGGGNGRGFRGADAADGRGLGDGPAQHTG